MPTQAIYNRWRGQTFADILGQDHITTTLKNQIRAGRIGHAYLFTGLRGTGKTSTARIMAKAVNCIGGTDDPPCNHCSICGHITEGRSLDLIEIDGASNRGIDEIRELRDRVAFSPSECRFKVYVVDEVHMLTLEAFNALLKTLEEPPPHVIFILCTTDPQKLPGTVLSRCQRFDFRRASVAIIIGKLRRICEQERIDVAPDALEYIARRSTGSFRDAESLLDQLAAYGDEQITLETVRGVLGSVAPELVGRVVQGIVMQDLAGGLGAISEALDGGADPRQLLDEILEYLRDLLLVRLGVGDTIDDLADDAVQELRRTSEGAGVSPAFLVKAIRLFNDAGTGLRTAVRAHIPLELAYVESCMLAATQRGRTEGALESPSRMLEAARVPSSTEATSPVSATRQVGSSQGPISQEGRIPKAPSRDLAAIPAPSAEMAAVGRPGTPPEGERKDSGDGGHAPRSADIPTAEQVSGNEANSGGGESAEGPKLTLEWVRGNWRQVLLRVRPLAPQVQALLNSSAPVDVQGDAIIIGCNSDLVRDKLSTPKSRQVVEQVLTQVLGRRCHIRCVVEDVRDEQQVEQPLPEGSDLFTTSGEGSARDKLLSHPAVKELQRLGGRISRVVVNDDVGGEGNRG